MLSKYQRECVALCVNEGLRLVGIEHRGKHWAVICIEGKVTFPCTPSDHRSLKNMKCVAKRLAAKAAA